MPIALLTRDELIFDLQALYASIDDSVLVSKDTDAGVRIQVLAEALIGLQSQLGALQDDLFPGPDCSSEALVKHAEARFGPNPKKAATTTDVIEDALAVRGTPGSAIPAGSTLVHEDGTRYQVTVAATLDADGAAFCTVQSIDTGTRCNRVQLDVLTFEEPPSGIQPQAQLVLALTGATDEETDAELLVRLLDAIRNPHAGGRFSDYRQWAMLHAKVRAAYSYGPSSASVTGRRGLGCVDVAILGQGSGSARIPSTTVRDEVTELIDARRPSAMAGYGTLLPAAVEQDFSIFVEPEPDYEFDWLENGASYVASVWAPTTRTITWSPSRPASVIAGSRLQIDGVQVTVVSVNGNDTVVNGTLSGLQGKSIYPGGPLVGTVQSAIRAHMDTLGPAKGVAYDRDRAGWEDSVKPAKIYREILGVPGVADAQVSVPSSVVSPADHAPSGTVDLLVYGTITVRRMV